MLWSSSPATSPPTGHPERARATVQALILSALYHDVADVTVDVEPFHSLNDDPTGAIVRHTVKLLAAGDTDADAKESGGHDPYSRIPEVAPPGRTRWNNVSSLGDGASEREDGGETYGG